MTGCRDVYNAYESANDCLLCSLDALQPEDARRVLQEYKRNKTQHFHGLMAVKR